MTSRMIIQSLIILTAAWLSADEQPALTQNLQATHPTSQSEARSRALLLHEMVHGTLQIMHRDFFDADDARAIPSASFEDVFHEMEKSFEVQMKWLIVNTDVVNFEHEAQNNFEKSAVTALASGKPYMEAFTSDRYHFAGAIRLGSQCLKCHVKLRTSNEDRTAGLVITMPLSNAK